MRLSDIGEPALIEIIRKRFANKKRDVLIGIGDDTAVIKPRRENLLLTTDSMVENVHFNMKFTTPYQLGFKIVSVNSSDIYAMGGRPYYLLLDLAMNRNTESQFIDSFFEGIDEASKLYRINLVGGNLATAEKMVANATLIGYAKKPVKRSGAHEGDKIYVTGNLGDSACGLEILKRLKTPFPVTYKTKIPASEKLKRRLSGLGLSSDIAEPLVKRHLIPEARNSEAFAKHATSMIDISDGLFIDLSRLCRESNVGARIYREKIPLSEEMKRAAHSIGLDPLRLAYAGGEDYEILFTAPKNKKITAICIGEIIRSGLRIVDDNGKEKAFSPEGYKHFENKR